jgi:hypothetical protein
MNTFYFLWRSNPTRTKATTFLNIPDRTKLQTHTRYGYSERVISVRRTGRYLHNTLQTKQTNIDALSEIRTGDPINQAASDLLQPHGHLDRQVEDKVIILCFLFILPRATDVSLYHP